MINSFFSLSFDHSTVINYETVLDNINSKEYEVKQIVKVTSKKIKHLLKNNCDYINAVVEDVPKPSRNMVRQQLQQAQHAQQ